VDDKVTMLPDQPVAQLTVSQLEMLVTAIVRRVVREELRPDYYVNEQGIKVLYAAEEAAPSYLAELREDYEAIQQGEVELSDSKEVVQELRDLGLDV
jgi:tRNA A37 threonylcarbamoyladenosine dehydratase